MNKYEFFRQCMVLNDYDIQRFNSLSRKRKVEEKRRHKAWALWRSNMTEEEKDREHKEMYDKSMQIARDVLGFTDEQLRSFGFNI